MAMIDHVTFSVSSFSRSVAFYDQAFAPLGVTRLYTVPLDQSDGANVTGYGDTRPWFWIAEDSITARPLHIALGAATRDSVDQFHAAACLAGGTDNGPPGLRPQYHPDYYAAFILDPDGHNIEAVCHDPQGAGALV